MVARTQRAGGEELVVSWQAVAAGSTLAGSLVLIGLILWGASRLEHARLQAVAEAAEARLRALEESRDPQPAALPTVRLARTTDLPPPGAIQIHAAPTVAQASFGRSPADWRSERRWIRESSPYERTVQLAAGPLLEHELTTFHRGDFAPDAARPKRSEQMVLLEDGLSVPRWAALVGTDPIQRLGEQALLDDLWENSVEVNLGASHTKELGSQPVSVLSNQKYTLENPHHKGVVRSRSDLTGLPFIYGEESLCKPADAATLDRHSRQFRGLRETGHVRVEAIRELTRQQHWQEPEAIRALNQLMPGEPPEGRMLYCELLAAMPDQRATQSIAKVAVFDPSPQVRQHAQTLLRERPIRDVRPVLLEALRYPWPAAAQHAAEALVALDDQHAVGFLTELVDLPDPRLPRQDALGAWMTAELVRINHQQNCLLCHAATDGANRVLRASTTSSQAYYSTSEPPFVRADITYVRQDFSIRQPLSNLRSERVDYVVKQRPATPREIELAQQAQAARAAAHPVRVALAQPAQPLDWNHRAARPVSEPNPHREAVLFALNRLTGLQAGTTTEDWRKAYWDAWEGPEHEGEDNGSPALRSRRTRN